MNKHTLSLGTLALFLLLLPGCVIFQSLGLYTPPPTVQDQIRQLRRDVATRHFGVDVPAGTRIDTVRVDTAGRNIEVDFTEELSYLPIREATTPMLQRAVQQYFAEALDSFSVSILSMHRPLDAFVPNYYRSDSSRIDHSRLPKAAAPRPAPVVRNASKPFVPARGLFERNIGLWHSHGWYFNNDLNRWEWQRPRLFLTVEDLIPTSFVLPYVIPMLENAGANVFVPRERDLQTNEAIVDNDSPSSGYSEHAPAGFRWGAMTDPGFGIGRPPYGLGVNPFHQGTVRTIRADLGPGASVRWTPAIPQGGEYAVYVSYASLDSGVTDARYTVHHLGGATEFLVNQQIGGGTWIYLGQFRFRAGIHPDSGSVVLTGSENGAGKYLTADAVRFGGGMGVVARGGQVSGRPKFVEGSRYWLQFAGMPDTLVFSFSRERSDYRDDYQSRAEYLNFLRGSPFGPNRDRLARGLGIPVDLSLAFHTDAGITNNDTTVGTLLVYTLEGTDSAAVFPDSMSRWANRDFADILQTQIVEDVRATFDPAWNRRQLRNGDYSESRRPNMPSALLELLSHQNFVDMKFMLDPRFRFTVSRAIYKGMLRFLASQHGVPYVVQPLPVTHFASALSSDGGVLLQWRPCPDPLEPSAMPSRYVVYTRMGDGGFDNGRLVNSTSVFIPALTPGVLYSFKVTAVNDGGESFPSEILAACSMPNSNGSALVVNAFDRVSGPLTVDAPEFKGFLPTLDAGVPDHANPGFTGEQYSFTRTAPFRSNDAPGHGASFADNEGRVIAGNTFDFPAVHGRAFMANGWSFASASDEAVMDSTVSLEAYRLVDLILGEEKATRWQRTAVDTLLGPAFQAIPPAMQTMLTRYLTGGGNLFASGAYVGSDLFREPKRDTLSVQFARRTLHFDWITDHAARTGRVVCVDSAFLPRGTEIVYNTQASDALYAVEAPDAVGPSDSSLQILRYAENQFGAGIAFKRDYGVVVTGFPFEAIPDFRQQAMLMRGILQYLKP